jgi:hypothetical protein
MFIRDLQWEKLNALVRAAAAFPSVSRPLEKIVVYVGNFCLRQRLELYFHRIFVQGRPLPCTRLAQFGDGQRQLSKVCGRYTVTLHNDAGKQGVSALSKVKIRRA